MIVAALLSSSCASMKRTQPVLNFSQQLVPNSLTTEQVKKCILLAGVKRKWHMREIHPGIIHGIINVRSHEAEIDIPYSNKEYSINYRSSENLKYNDGMIHRNYNKWIKLLNAAIQKNMRSTLIKDLK